MNTLHIQMFGSLRLTWASHPRPLAVPPSLRPLLAYLVLFHRRSHPRDRLGELFWPELAPDRARRCLNTALWRLRRIMEPRASGAGPYLLTERHNGVQFNGRSDHWLDVTVFEQTLSRFLSAPVPAVSRDQIDQIEQALALYTGELLEELDTEWIVPERERLRLLRMHACARLMHWYRHHGELERSIQLGHSLLVEDPLQEGVHQELIRLYLAQGQRPLALQQYETCRRVLSEELDVSPMAETEALLSNPHPPAPHSPPHALPPAIQPEAQILERLQRAWRGYKQAQLELERALQDLFQLRNPRQEPEPDLAHNPFPRSAPTASSPDDPQEILR